jgi:hypothetical protein
MERKLLLQEVNRLVSTGLRKSAIDLINEYLEDYPNDSSVLSALGRIYLLEKNPDQAIKYLQLALGTDNSGLTTNNVVTSYGFDELDHDDLDYIDNSATADDLNFSYENEDGYQFTPSTNLNNLGDANNQIIEPTNQKESEQTNENVSFQITTEVFEDLDFESDKDEDDFDPEFIEIYATSTLDNEDYVLPYQSEVYDKLFNEVLEIPDYVDDEEIGEADDTIVIEEAKSIEDEFDWDGIEDFDDIDEQDIVPFLQDYEVITGGKVSRIERAKQIAVDVIQSYDWGIQNIGLLQQVFYENGWAACRVAIEHELVRGLTPDELELAIFVRRLWIENQQYWISFIHVTSNLPGQETRAAYKCMSWREALRIIRIFNQIPSEEEIQLFIDDIYDDWYCSPISQRQYKAFIRYLKYRTGSVRHTLPANEWFSFNTPVEEDNFIELPRDEIKQVKGFNALKDQGIDLEDMLQDLEQKYDVLKPAFKEEDNFYLMQVDVAESKSKSKSKPKAAPDDMENDDLDIDEIEDPTPPIKIKPQNIGLNLEAFLRQKKGIKT